SAAGNRLVADSIANTWEIDGSGEGLLNGSIAVRGFSELEGGAAADAFTIESLAGPEFIDGGDAPSGQADTLTLSSLIDNLLMRIADAGEAAGEAQPEADLGITNLENDQANEDNSNSLIAARVANSWTVDGLNQGRVNTTHFSGFSQLTGRELADSFAFVGSDAFVSGLLDGGEGNNSIDLSAATGRAYRLELGNVLDDADVLNTLGIDEATGNGHSGSTLIIAAGDNRWTISTADSGTVDGVAFNKFANLEGGSGADDSILQGATAAVSGTIDGQGGSNSLTGRDDNTLWQLTGENSGYLAIAGRSPEQRYVDSFRNIQTLNGGAAADTLIGNAAENTWTITAENAGGLALGEADEHLLFTGMENLSGGDLDDRFVITDGSISGDLRARGGDDTVVLNDRSVGGLVSGGDGDDEFLLTAASGARSEEHTSELQSRENLVCRLLLEK